MKVDGRALRRHINDYVDEHFPGKDPLFTVRTIPSKKMYGNTKATLEVRFDELDQDALDVWSEVAEWILNEWWPDNQRHVTASIKEWDGGWRGKFTTRNIPVENVSVSYYFTH